MTIGILFFFTGMTLAPATAGDVARILAAELLRDGLPREARLEARRALALNPEDAVSAAIRDSVSVPGLAIMPERRGLTERAIRLWIGFYRAQISPALGARCSLFPSCSEYCLQAVRRHGFLGLALYGDRAVREPDVVKNADTPIVINGRIFYADPLSDHDFWLRNHDQR